MRLIRIQKPTPDHRRPKAPSHDRLATKDIPHPNLAWRVGGLALRLSDLHPAREGPAMVVATIPGWTI
jgi:hypothetical protein